MKSFKEKVEEAIKEPLKKRIPITFPEDVFISFDKFAKENTADCYWLAIKQLIDFWKEQHEGDLRTIMVLKIVEELREQVEELDKKVTELSIPKKDNFQTFGKKEEVKK